MEHNTEIIVNGVDVSKCDRLIVNQLYGYVCNCEEDTHIISSCKNRHNCYYKQLARKTTECEELKNKLNEYERAGGILDEGEAWYGLAKRYEQALEEIEHKIIHDYCVGCDYSCDVCEYKEILDIITKAKEGNYDKM